MPSAKILSASAVSPWSSTSLLATDGATRFARVGGQFLGHDLSPDDIQIVDL